MQTVDAGYFVTMLGWMSVQAGVLVLVVLLAQGLFRKKLSRLTLVLMCLLGVSFLTDAKQNNETTSSTPSTTATAGQPQLPHVVDLKPYYTFHGDDGYGGFTGRQTVDGLPFDIAGQIVMFGKTSAQRGSRDPREVSGIIVDRKFDELHLIHDVVWEDAFDQPVATIRLHYADGSSHDFVLKYGVQVADWNRLLSEETEMLTDTNSKVIRHYEGVDQGTGRLFETVLNNPFPRKLVKTMDVISSGGWATYRLAAATVADHDPNRPVTPGLPLNQPPRHFDGALKVKVLDQETGAPIANADVLGYTMVSGQGIVIPPLLTSSNGETAIKYPIADTASIGFTVSKQGYLGHRGYWQAGDIPKSITYKLVRSRMRIQGTVVDDAGHPVVGAQVRLNTYNFDQVSRDNQVYLPNVTTQTDTNGHWSIGGLPKNYQNFGVTVTHPDFPQAQFYADGPHNRGFQGNHIRTADFFDGKAVLKLTTGGKLSGSVTDTNGNAPANVHIFVGFSRYMSGPIKATTDVDGNFHLKNLGLGENYLTISAPGYAPAFRTINVGSSNAPLNVALQPGRIINGRVVDAEGKPIADADVSYDGLANRQGMFTGRTMEWETKTDTKGTFTWYSAPTEPVRLTIRKNGHMALMWKTVQTDTTNTTTFVLSSPLTVKGTVTDVDSGKPVPKFTITPGWPEGGNGGARFEKRRSSTEKNGHYEVHYESPIIISPTPYDFVFRISAPGYAPAQSRAIHPDAGDVTWNVKLKKTPSITVTVKTTDGKPAADVSVLLSKTREYLQLDGTSLNIQNQNDESFQTDAEGRFELPPQVGDYRLIAASPAGFGIISKVDLTNTDAIILRPWGRIEGTLLNHGRPLAGKELYFFVGDGSDNLNVWRKTPVAVDDQGRFAFPNVPAGTIRIELKQPMTANSWSYKELQTVDVDPGATNTVHIILNGRDVIGHWKRSADMPADADLTQGNFYLRPKMDPAPIPKELDSPEKIQAWFKTWSKTEAGKKYMAAERKMATLRAAPDGTLRAEAVAPGTYTLSGNFWSNGGSVAEVESREVTIPTSSANAPDQPFDLGEVVVKPVKHLNIGQEAPDFSVKTLDGKSLKLSDYRGKYVLLDFWATWCGPCVAETPHLKAAYDAYGDNPQFVMISLSLDQKTAQPKEFVKKHDIQWLQGFLGDWSKDTVTKDYSVQGIPSIFLIGPDGKIIAQNLRGERIKSAVGSALPAK